MGKPYGKGHKRRGLVTGKAEGIDLIPFHSDAVDLFFRKPGFVKTQVLCQGQFFDARKRCAGPAAEELIVVTDLIDNILCHICDIYQGCG